MAWGTLFYHAVIVHILCVFTSLALVVIIGISPMDTIDVWLLLDSEKSKDFRLGDSYYLPGGDINEQVELNFSQHESGGGVLLNTVNVSSIEYIVHEDYGSDSA